MPCGLGVGAVDPTRRLRVQVVDEDRAAHDAAPAEGRERVEPGAGSGRPQLALDGRLMFRHPPCEGVGRVRRFEETPGGWLQDRGRARVRQGRGGLLGAWCYDRAVVVQKIDRDRKATTNFQKSITSRRERPSRLTITSGERCTLRRLFRWRTPRRRTRHPPTRPR